MSERVKETYGVLVARDHSRCKPDQPEGVWLRIREAFEQARSFSLVGFWGVGERDSTAPVDAQALDFLAGIVGRLPLSSTLTLILADEHGRLNGRDGWEAANYLADVARLAEARNFTTVYLSAFWRKWGLDEPFGTMTDFQWDQNPLAHILEERSRKHYRGPHSARQEAQRYYLMCRRERVLVPSEYPEAVWWTYSSPDFAEILPAMPRVYFWSLRKGMSAPAWFL